ncbi:MAG: hypothetical protein LBD23_09090 [Oscillospiraceae bacterium]|jgi:hypothetical protein|nr:hypothetical protein [Oscillospiraceae bacterium]
MSITRTSKTQKKNKRANRITVEKVSTISETRKRVTRINGKRISMIPVSDNQHDAIPVSYDVVKNNLQLVTQETLKTATVNIQA